MQKVISFISGLQKDLFTLGNNRKLRQVRRCLYNGVHKSSGERTATCQEILLTIPARGEPAFGGKKESGV